MAQKKAAKPKKKSAKPVKKAVAKPKKALKKPQVVGKQEKPLAKSVAPVKGKPSAAPGKTAKKEDILKAKIETAVKEVEELEALLKEDEANDIELRDAEGRLYCKVRDCDELSVVEGYCRFHYLRLWKKIQLRKKILADGKLDKYIDDLTQRYPDKFVEMIRNDLRTEKDFLAAIHELDIDESSLDAEAEEDQGLMDEVRGIATGGDEPGGGGGGDEF